MKGSDIKLGASPLSWMNSDIPELGSEIPLERCLEEVSRIGYAGIELEDPFRKILNVFPDLLKKNKLRLIGGWHSTFLLENSLEMEIDRLQEHLELLDSLGGKVVNLAECSFAIHREGKPLSQKPHLHEGQWKKLAEGLDTLAEIIEDSGFVSAYHHHMGTVVQDAEEIDYLMRHTEHLGLLFDTGHLVYAQEDPHAVLKRHLPRITHVHCKNVRGTVLEKKIEEDADFFTAIIDGAFTVPGDDVHQLSDYFIDFKEIIATLKNSGYQGWIVMEAEQDPKKAPPYDYAKLGHRTLASFLT